MVLSVVSSMKTSAVLIWESEPLTAAAKQQNCGACQPEDPCSRDQIPVRMLGVPWLQKDTEAQKRDARSTFL